MPRFFFFWTHSSRREMKFNCSHVAGAPWGWVSGFKPWTLNRCRSAHRRSLSKDHYQPSSYTWQFWSCKWRDLTLPAGWCEMRCTRPCVASTCGWKMHELREWMVLTAVQKFSVANEKLCRIFVFRTFCRIFSLATKPVALTHDWIFSF